jgi:hypothetical protein
MPEVPGIGDMPGAAGVLMTVETLVQGVVEKPVTGTPCIAGLSPGIPISVAPSGMPVRFDPDAKPGMALGWTVLDAVPDAPEPQLVPVVELDADPPPSNGKLNPAASVSIPDIPVEAAAMPEQFALASGLSPTVFNSVAPIGIPPGPEGALAVVDPTEDIVPTGDVTPMPPVPMLVPPIGLT